jgi:hypothetical protein
MYTVRYKNTSIRVLLTIFPPRDYLHSVRRLKSSGDSPVSFNFKDRKSDSLVKFLFNSFTHIVYTQAFTHIDTRIPRNLWDYLRRSEINLRSEFPKAPWFDGCPIAHSVYTHEII